MSQKFFFETLGDLPQSANSETRDVSLEHLETAVRQSGNEALATTFDDLRSHSAARTLIDAILGNSPFLTWCATIDPEFFCNLLRTGPCLVSESILNVLINKRKESLNEAELMKLLRVAKRQMALTIAVADLTDTWSLEQVTSTLSDLACACLSVATAHLLRETAKSGGISLVNPDDPEVGSGFIILGMGKLGARELNYSSDIDLIVLYDPEIITSDDPDRLQTLMVRMTRKLVKLMEERTGDGYVFRTDLRLRPDPGATPIALSTYAAETYYESLGQNWERMAMIKARPLAGDLEAGQQFLKWLTPFIWRKSLDYDAIQDIQAIKRQINVHKAGNKMEVPGHNIKLGRGGIREIEFFAQTQQLIWGGREPELRSPFTLEAIPALAAFGLCSETTCTELTTSYRFLRRLEHRLQMINDEQTQTLPTKEDELRTLALFSGYADTSSFIDKVEMHIQRVHATYADLFRDAPSKDTEGDEGNLVFTGSDADPDTLKTISSMGFAKPETVDAVIRGWHHGRYRATHSTRAREILTSLMPQLLRAIASTRDPMSAFLRFDEFLRGLPAGVQLFSMFRAQPAILTLVAEIMGKAPRLARHLAGRSSVLDSVLAPDFFDPPLTATELEEELDLQLSRVSYLEDVLNVCRRWVNDRRFQIGVQSLQGLIDSKTASESLSDIAQTALRALYPRVADDFATQHGRVASSQLAVLAMGKLGSREMTASSDLDLVFIYDVPDEVAQSDGEKPLAATQYFARLGQRYINSITALTQEGRLYEVDMRLRPSGNSGPIATTLKAFRQYHETDAWTWEHMALTRARVVVAKPEFGEMVQGAVQHALTSPRDPVVLREDVAKMRKRLAKEKPADGTWSLKQMRGGMVDIEFIAQFLQLNHAADNPGVLSPNTTEALQNLSDAGYLDARTGSQLVSTLNLWQSLQGMLSLTVEEEMTKAREAEMSEALKNDLVAIASEPDYPRLEARIKDEAAQVHQIFQTIVGE